MGQYVYQFRCAGDDGIGLRPRIAERLLSTRLRRSDALGVPTVPESRLAALRH